MLKKHLWEARDFSRVRLHGLDGIHHQMEENELISAMKEIGYTSILKETVELPNGKALMRLDFRNAKCYAASILKGLMK